jgi:molybdate transport system substrate-binding protein
MANTWYFVTAIAPFVLFFLFIVNPAKAGEIRIAAGVGMKDVLNELTSRYEKKHPETRFSKNFAPSGVLAGQLENGAATDLFIAANTKWMNYVKEKHLVDEKSIRILAKNSLVFTGRTTKKVSGMKDLAYLDKIGLGSPKSVPAGEYAIMAIHQAGLDKKLKGKLVMARDVRESLMYAEMGEVDGSFVFLSDALLAIQSKTRFTVPQHLHPEIVFPMALTVKAISNAEAISFHAYLQENEAKTVLKKYGFTVNHEVLSSSR